MSPAVRGRSSVVAVATLALAGILLAACGNGPSASSTATSSSASRAVSPVAMISADWSAFFSGHSTAARRIALLEDGSQFATIINGMSSSSLAKSTTAKVKTVTMLGASQAKVVYTIYLGGAAALKNDVGDAVKQAGTWKVSSASFCVLLGLEGVKTPACPSS